MFGVSFGCSIGTDSSISTTEKPLNQSGFDTKEIVAEGSGTEINGHPQVIDSKITPRKIVVPPEVKDRWKAVKFFIQNKQDDEGRVQIVELGTSVTPASSGLKMNVGPFLPNFIMDKMTYTSRGNKELNPAVQLIVEENGKIIYKGWAFKKFPSMYAFEHELFSIKLLGAIPAVAS